MKQLSKSILKYSFAFVILSITMISCKKGPDDPAISFRSRKARVTNEWNLSKTNKNGSAQNSIGTTTYKFDKNGTGDRTYEFNNVKVIDNFRWDFVGGNGSFKNRERLVIYGNNDPSGVIYEILELRHDIMRLQYIEDNGNNKDTYELTLEN